VATNGEKNIDWIETDNQFTVKHQFDQWSLEGKKIIGRWFDSIGEKNWGDR
jgi:hypothetical protein